MSSPRRLSGYDSSFRRVRLAPPVIMMVLVAIAVPIELRRPTLASLSFTPFPSDVVLNILGFLPVGFVLARLNPLRAGASAAAISACAEAGQLFMMHRQPSGMDLVCNVAGAFAGALLVPRRGRRKHVLVADRRAASVSALLGVGLLSLVWARAPLPLSHRGWTRPGTLEAHWALDKTSGRRAIDSSGQGHDGTFSGEPQVVPGMVGHAVRFIHSGDYVYIGRSTAFRLVGSMTICAWIKMDRVPPDDAAIVSSHNGIGFQLDTTVDRGPRTIGFKLGNACGNLMARYGATRLTVGEWYHVAGVYDARAKALHVYLNGRPDDGFLLGTVTSSQRASREPVYIGRRSSDRGFEFVGSIDDVRIYSRALTTAEVQAVMRGAGDEDPTSSGGAALPPATAETAVACARSDREDARLPGFAGVLGVLVALVCLGVRPTIGWVPCAVGSIAAGVVLLPGAAPSLPVLGWWTIPLTSLAGTASVVVASAPAPEWAP